MHACKQKTQSEKTLNRIWYGFFFLLLDGLALELLLAELSRGEEEVEEEECYDARSYIMFEFTSW